MQNMDNERLIELVYVRKQLWDVRDRNYHNRDYSRKLWNEIATELNCTGHLVKSKWQNLRDTYRKEYMKLLRTTGDPSSKGPHWKYYDRLAFLNEVLALRKKPTPSLSSGKRSYSRRQAANAADISTGQSEDEEENHDTEEYTDINPLRYLCEVPQLISEENEDLSSVHDTISNDALSATENQDSNNNHNSVRMPTINLRKSKRIIKKNMTKNAQETATHMEDDSAQNQDYVDFEVQQDQYDIVYPNTTCSIKTSGFAKGFLNYDEDYHFLMSILPHLREIPKSRKLNVRQKLQQIILDEQLSLRTPKSLSNSISPAFQQPLQTAFESQIPQATERTTETMKEDKYYEKEYENDIVTSMQHKENEISTGNDIRPECD